MTGSARRFPRGSSWDGSHLADLPLPRIWCPPPPSASAIWPSLAPPRPSPFLTASSSSSSSPRPRPGSRRPCRRGRSSGPPRPGGGRQLWIRGGHLRRRPPSGSSGSPAPPPLRPQASGRRTRLGRGGARLRDPPAPRRRGRPHSHSHSPSPPPRRTSIPRRRGGRTERRRGADQRAILLRPPLRLNPHRLNLLPAGTAGRRAP